MYKYSLFSFYYCYYYLVVIIIGNKVVDHSEEVHKEGDEEEDELADGDLLEGVEVVVDLGGVDFPLLLLVAVRVPPERREVVDHLDPVPGKQEQDKHHTEDPVLDRHKRVQAPRKVDGAQVYLKVTV